MLGLGDKNNNKQTNNLYLFIFRWNDTKSGFILQ